VLRLADSILSLRGLLKDLYIGLAKVEKVLVTLEELMDKEGLEKIHNHTKKSSSEIKKLLSE